MTRKVDIDSVKVGEYEVIHEYGTEDGRNVSIFYARRHGQHWRSLTGDNLVMALMHEIIDLRTKIDMVTVSDADKRTLRRRCIDFASRFLRRRPTGDDLLALVLAELGRRASPDLQDSKALVLYFTTDADRDEMIAAGRMAKPDMISKRVP
jgi:hypothetical protein